MRPAIAAAGKPARLVIATGATGTPNAARAYRASTTIEASLAPTAGWACVQDDQRPAGNALDHIERSQDRPQIEDHRPGGDQYQVGQRGDMRHIGLDAGAGVDHRNVEAVRLGSFEHAP